MELDCVLFGNLKHHHKLQIPAINMDVYHYNRCSKSRQVVDMLQEHDLSPNIIDYQAAPPSIDTLKDLMNRSQQSHIEFLRWNRDLPISKDGSFEEVLVFLVQNPQHLQRPIVDDGVNVVVARPIEQLKAIPDCLRCFSSE